jgi:uncharacterized protein YceH (UPF0502 family)
VRLSREEARVIGSLIEKELTTPQQYPLTMNALVLACNQTSNRDPVVEFEERTVDNALASLKAAGLLRFVYPSHGRSVTRYQQLLGEQLGISEPQLALVAALLLRGPQTSGELRARTERMTELDGIPQVEDELERLSSLTEPLVARFPRRPGQKEERWAQLLTDDAADLAEALVDEPAAGSPSSGRPADEAELRTEVGELRTDVAELRAEVAELRDHFERLRRDLYE